MKSRHFLVAFLFAWLWVIVACGGGGGGSSSGSGSGSDGGTTGTLMSPDERAAAMADVVTQLKVTNPDSQADADSLVAYLKGHPAFSDAGYNAKSDNVWATFKDGVPIIFCDNLKPDSTPQPTVLPDAKPQIADAVPFNQQYRILYSLGNAFGNNSAVVGTMVKNVGYNPAARMSAEVKDLMTDIHDDGFFMWSTHCGLYDRKIDENSSIETFGMSCATYWTKENEKQEPYKSLLKGGYTGIAWGAENNVVGGEQENENTFLKDNLTHRAYYMIQPKFIRKYFKFKANSLVVLNACTSFDPIITGSFGFGGASTVVGWSKPCSRFAEFTGRLIDLLCGANKYEPKQDPPQRPFGIQEVFDWLEANDLVAYQDTIDGVPGTVQMGYVAYAGRFGPLTPSIRSFTITEGLFAQSKSYIHIKGIFGPKDGGLYARQAFVNGQGLAIVDGDDSTIIAEIPSTGTASFGPLQVKVNGRGSNVVPITLWNIKMKYDFDGPESAAYTIDMDYKLRLDVHKFREKPGEDPTGDLVDFFTTNKSTASFTAQGTFDNGALTHGRGLAPSQILR